MGKNREIVKSIIKDYDAMVSCNLSITRDLSSLKTKREFAIMKENFEEECKVIDMEMAELEYQKYENSQLINVVEHSIQVLGERRNIFILYYLKHMKVSTIAKRLNLSTNAVSYRLNTLEDQFVIWFDSLKKII